MDQERGQFEGDKPIVYQDVPEDFVTTVSIGDYPLVGVCIDLFSRDDFCQKRATCMSCSSIEVMCLTFYRGERVEMGANQCIIVRDSKAKEKLRKQLGSDVGIILYVSSVKTSHPSDALRRRTVYQSKGLEFNDVCCRLPSAFPSH